MKDFIIKTKTKFQADLYKAELYIEECESGPQPVPVKSLARRADVVVCVSKELLKAVENVVDTLVGKSLCTVNSGEEPEGVPCSLGNLGEIADSLDEANRNLLAALRAIGRIRL